MHHGSAATTIASGAISVPANSIITRLTCIVEKALAQASGNVGVSAGTAAAGTQFTGTLDADCLEASSTSVAAGVGTSTDDVWCDLEGITVHWDISAWSGVRMAQSCAGVALISI